MAVVALLVGSVILPLATASHWASTTRVTVGPSQTKAARTVTFEVTVQNDGAAGLTVCQVDIRFQWDTNGWTIFSGTQNIPGGGSQTWTIDEAIPALQPGFYPDTVTVTGMVSSDILCTASDWMGNIQIVSNVPPIAAFAFSPTEIDTNTDVRFSDTSSDSDGTIVSWRWDFGDQTNSNIQNPMHRYVSAGVYRVSLNVTDSDGATNSVTQNVPIGAAPLGGGPRIAGLGILEWTIVGAVIAAIAVSAIFLRRRRKRTPRRWMK